MDFILLDFQKSFDKVPHIRLLEIIKAHGFGDRKSARQQRVVISVV